MAIATTATFNPDIGEIVEEAYERAGLEMRSGYDLRTARRSLNFLTLEWQNRGLNLWTVDEQRISVSTVRSNGVEVNASGVAASGSDTITAMTSTVGIEAGCSITGTGGANGLTVGSTTANTVVCTGTAASTDLEVVPYRFFKERVNTESELHQNYLVKDVSSYALDSDTVGILDLTLRVNDAGQSTQTDYSLNRISESSYAAIPNKLTTGRPLQYYVERVGILDTALTGNPANRRDKIHLWPVPDSGELVESTQNKYKILYYRVRRIADAGLSAAETMEVPARFLPALVSGLAYHIAMKRPEATERAPLLKQIYEETFQMAAEEDRDKSTLRFVPRVTR